MKIGFYLYNQVKLLNFVCEDYICFFKCHLHISIEYSNTAKLFIHVATYEILNNSTETGVMETFFLTFNSDMTDSFSLIHTKINARVDFVIRHKDGHVIKTTTFLNIWQQQTFWLVGIMQAPLAFCININSSFLFESSFF